MNTGVKSTFYLVLCAMIWGTGFVAQRAGMESMSPFYFSAFRMLVGALALLPIAYVTQRFQNKEDSAKETTTSSKEKKSFLQAGLVCGIVIFFAGNFQQIGLVSVGAGKAAFITTLYIVLVPVLGLFLRHKTRVFHWVGVVLGTAGLYFLSITQEFSIAPGDAIILIGALFWAIHILCMNHYAPRFNVAKLVSMQFFIAGVPTMVVALLTEEINYSGFLTALPGILYLGIMSTAIAFTLQALGQKKANPTVASIILSTEALFGALGGYLILGEVLTTREIIGCVLMFGAVIITQLPSGKVASKQKKRSNP